VSLEPPIDDGVDVFLSSFSARHAAPSCLLPRPSTGEPYRPFPVTLDIGDQVGYFLSFIPFHHTTGEPASLPAGAKVIRTEFQGEAYKAFKVLGLRPPEKFQVLAETAREKATEAKPELT
jgi:hypothetical protein